MFTILGYGNGILEFKKKVKYRNVYYLFIYLFIEVILDSEIEEDDDWMECASAELVFFSRHASSSLSPTQNPMTRCSSSPLATRIAYDVVAIRRLFHQSTFCHLLLLFFSLLPPFVSHSFLPLQIHHYQSIFFFFPYSYTSNQSNFILSKFLFVIFFLNLDMKLKFVMFYILMYFNLKFKRQ